MNEQELMTVYAQALMQERERFLYHAALNKAAVITRSMKPEEKEAYLTSQAFANTLYQVRRRDRIYQGLRRGELLNPADRAEFDRLLPLLRSETAAGRKPDLAFLRTAENSRIAPGKAREILLALKAGRIKKIFRADRERHLKHAEKRVCHYLMAGDLTRLIRIDSKVEKVLPFLMDKVFRRGLSLNVVNQAMLPRGFSGYLQEELNRSWPDISRCGRIRTESGKTVAEEVRREIDVEKTQLVRGLQKRFHNKRIEALLKKNQSLRKLQLQADGVFEQERQIRSALLDAIPDHFRDLYPLAREMKRKVILHIGPTNSGKTHESVERLRGASNGIYLGPLRLLAAEQFETLNMEDVPCSLVTGEEQIRVPGSRVQSSTVEMADLRQHYDVAVIDECQMIGDRDRGGAWTAAILGLCAEELHLCASPDAEMLLRRIAEDCGDEMTVVRHERMTPLEVEKTGFRFPESVRAGDALIVFSKARVHAVAAELKNKGYRVSLIYGALPPDVRRNQAQRFMQRETDVVVSTDAIAMGMNLPIQRVVFLESEKFDGDITRTLTDAEIKQIAGRAGRYGIYDIGYVNAFGFRGLVASALERPLLPLQEAVIRFPESLLGIPLPLTGIIRQWLNMQDKDYFSKASAVRMESLAAMMETRNTDKALLYRFLCIPFDETDPDLLSRWKHLYHAQCAGETVDVPAALPEMRDPDECTIQVLDILEADFRRCDLYYNYARLFLSEPEKLLEEIQRRKDLISQGIIHILSTQKLQARKCKTCGRNLPWNWPYTMCDGCFRRENIRYGGPRGRRSGHRR